jgi:hypothetical protein
MLDYESDFVYMIPIEYSVIQTFYEDITITPARIRGAIISNNEKESKKIQFRIKDANNNEVLDSNSKEFIFDFTTYQKGRFTFEFLNKKVS